MPIHILTHHPAYPPHRVEQVQVQVLASSEGGLWVEYHVEGSQHVILPNWQPGARADELWTTTCFELFFRREDAQSYLEFNFSPSGQWAAYAFDGYRAGMNYAPALNPDIMLYPEPTRLSLEAEPWPPHLTTGPAMLGLSAVIEEKGGRNSYWALAHPSSQPDFHHPDCFAAQAPPPPHA